MGCLDVRFCRQSRSDDTRLDGAGLELIKQAETVDVKEGPALIPALTVSFWSTGD